MTKRLYRTGPYHLSSSGRLHVPDWYLIITTSSWDKCLELVRMSTELLDTMNISWRGGEEGGGEGRKRRERGERKREERGGGNEVEEGDWEGGGEGGGRGKKKGGRKKCLKDKKRTCTYVFHVLHVSSYSIGNWNLMSHTTWYPRLVPSAIQFWNGSKAIDNIKPQEKQIKPSFQVM